MADASKIRRDLPYLANYGKDIDSWIEDFKNVMEIYNIEEPNRIFIWVKNAVEADIKNLLKSLCTTRNNVKRFPSYKEIQRAIEDYLEITQNDKCSILKALKIKRNETIKGFNYNYLTLYHRLDLEYKKLICVDDYLNAIHGRVYVHSQVILANCKTLTEAFEVAERAEKAEVRTITSKNSQNVMIYQNNINKNNNILLNHPIYRNLREHGNNLDNSRQASSYVMGYINENSTNNRMFIPGRYSNNKNKSFNNNNNYYHGVEQIQQNNTYDSRRFYNNYEPKARKSVICYSCKQVGHKAYECPNNNNNGSNRNNNLYNMNNNDMSNNYNNNFDYNNNSNNYNNYYNNSNKNGNNNSFNGSNHYFNKNNKFTGNNITNRNNNNFNENNIPTGNNNFNRNSNGINQDINTTSSNINSNFKANINNNNNNGDSFNNLN